MQIHSQGDNVKGVGGERTGQHDRCLPGGQ